jgi:hypothetical protein
MRNAKCASVDSHRWGYCLQNCLNCGSEDKITVNWCETDTQYVCYVCQKKKAS